MIGLLVALFLDSRESRDAGQQAVTTTRVISLTMLGTLAVALVIWVLSLLATS